MKMYIVFALAVQLAEARLWDTRAWQDCTAFTSCSIEFCGSVTRGSGKTIGVFSKGPLAGPTQQCCSEALRVTGMYNGELSGSLITKAHIDPDTDAWHIVTISNFATYSDISIHSSEMCVGTRLSSQLYNHGHGLPVSRVRPPPPPLRRLAVVTPILWGVSNSTWSSGLHGEVPQQALLLLLLTA